MFYLDTACIRMKMESNVFFFFNTPRPPLPITVFLSLASLHVAQTTTHHPESKHYSLLLFPF